MFLSAHSRSTNAKICDPSPVEIVISLRSGVRAVAQQLVWCTLSIQKFRTLLFGRTLRRSALVAFAEGALSLSSTAVIVAADCSQVGAYRCLLNRWPEKSLPRPRRAVGQDACASTASLKKDICSAESWSERLFTGFFGIDNKSTSFAWERQACRAIDRRGEKSRPSRLSDHPQMRAGWRHPHLSAHRQLNAPQTT